MFLRKISLIIRRNAGHSKWQNIRHTKALKDGQRAAMYSRFGHRIKMCIQGRANYFYLAYLNNDSQIVFSKD